MSQSARGPYLRASRIYRLWSFSANHNQLILRSEPSYKNGDQLRAEVYFGNVAFLALGPILRGIVLKKASAEASRRLAGAYGLAGAEDGVFVLNESETQFIVSGSPSWREAVREIDEPSLFDFDQPWPPPSGDVSWGSV